MSPYIQEKIRLINDPQKIKLYRQIIVEEGIPQQVPKNRVGDQNTLMEPLLLLPSPTEELETQNKSESNPNALHHVANKPGSISKGLSKFLLFLLKVSFIFLNILH